ncbi:MAG: putative quinol monooxygenase [Novosphingobium sp.]|jgi:quinol monooxygenase YgiN|uniref:putative quinol monooxygenase n=1 Tax=Novosphingobium sp. TaxID=1874826 RepID=UPI00391CF7A7|nr:antibiotic biosynthesis monooxygenase [Novosphingobium sp.]
MPIAIVGQFRIPVENLAVARPLMIAVMRASRAEDGCIEYNYAEDLADPGLIRVSEVWESREHLAAHFKSAHMLRWIAERADLGLTGRQVTGFAAERGEPL